MSSLAITDALLCICAIGLASQVTIKLGARFALGLIAIPALLGVLRFSGLYPLERWHQLFSILSASSAMPLLALCAFWPASVVATQKRYALIFLGAAALLGIIISGLAKVRIYDQTLALLSMALLLKTFISAKDFQGIAGSICMLAGSILFVTKMQIAGYLLPGDFLHLSLAIGLLLVTKTAIFQTVPDARK